MDSSRADDLVRQAEKKLASFSFFGLKSAEKYESAAALLEKAGTQYKLAKKWAEGGAAYERLGGLHMQNDSGGDAAAAYVEAAKCYQKTNKTDVVRVLHKAIEYYTENGRLGQAARQLREVAETTEKSGAKEECLVFYRQAGDLYDGEGQTSEASKCRMKIATISAEQGDYQEAIETFESTARAYVDNNLLKYSAKGLLLNAGICHLAVGDEVAIRTALERYEDIDMSWAGSREANLLKDLADACEEGDVEKFSQVLGEYDSMTKLDPWKTGILLKVKKRIPEEDFT